MKRKLKTNTTPDATKAVPDADKAKVVGLLEAVVADHLDAAEALKRLLSQIDQAAPYLISKFAAEADWDLALDHYQGSDAREHIFEMKISQSSYASLDEFLDFEAVSLDEKATERRRQDEDRQERRRARGREAEAA